MKTKITLAALFLAVSVCFGAGKDNKMRHIAPVDFSKVRIDDAFWSPRLESHKDVTLAVCIDQIENQTGRIRNFENAANGRGKHSGIYFDDSDVYKALEGMAYSLVNNPDPELEAKCDEWIAKFAAAQQPDGYLFTYYTLTGLEGRWTDMSKHEMYCAGHMIEAAVAYYKATGKRTFLDVVIKVADHMMTVFGPGKRHWVPGHEEIELALVKLSEVTGEGKYLDFAQWILEERGHGYGVWRWDPSYVQDDKPVREMSSIAGHAVRAMYLYCGMADVAALKREQAYMDALERLWEDVVFKKMYVTGGIGSSARNEGFTEEYDLPNLEAYCETCASVGMVLWNWRMNQFSGDAKYIDVLERSLYNGALAGISLEGDRFFYVNPLESKGDHHRQAWYGCACCPSQICRFQPSIGNYIYGLSDDALWINLFIGGTADLGDGVSVTQETDCPWGGNVRISISSKRKYKKSVRVRIPSWCDDWSIKVNGRDVEPDVLKGYAVLKKGWKDGDIIELSMQEPVRMVQADPRVKQDVGKRAVQRGPLVYCIEETDNKSGFEDLRLSAKTRFDASFDEDLLGGVVKIKAWNGSRALNYVPYYSWDNREAGRMKVWVDYED